MIDLAQWRCVVGAWSARILHRSQPHSVKWQPNSSFHDYSDLLLSGLYLLVYSVASNIRGVNLLLSVALVTTLLLLLCGDVERNPGPFNEFLRVFEEHLGVLIEAVPDPIKLANDMFSHGLVPDATKNAVLTTNEPHYDKSSTLLNAFHSRLKTLDETKTKEDLITLCKVIGDLPIIQEVLKDIGVTNPEMFFEEAVITENNFIQIMKKKASSIAVFQSEWPPSPIRFVDKEYYGRLMLLNMNHDTDQRQTAWYRTRGELDRIPVANSSDKLISINDILDDSKPGTILIDGPPGIGKTTLCRKIRQMWATGELKVKFKLALLISLRQREVVNATKLDELMQTAYKDDTIPSLCEHFHKDNVNGKGLLFIFDGWDEFPEVSKQCSFVSEIITRNRLYYCTVIVTSRSYASESLLRLCHDEPIDKHVQILGFSEDEVHRFIKAAFNENEAKSLISELELRNDISSICCIPVVCFMLIFVYKKMKKLPHTMTELYTNFILQTIKREVLKHSNTQGRGKYPFTCKDIKDISELPSPLNDSLDELCLFSFKMLQAEPNPTLVFDSQGLSQLMLAEENTFLGLMTPFQYYDEDCYQFIHLTIQEYLAALWMSKQPDCHELFKKYFKSPHFYMALRFVAGLTELKHPSYEAFFSVPVDLKCTTMVTPMFAQRTTLEMKTNECFIYPNFLQEAIVTSCVYHTHEDHDPFDHLYDKLEIRLLHFLYESQNIHLCETFALSISDFSVCTRPYSFSAFDLYCFIYFLAKSSDKPWKHIHLVPDTFSENLRIFHTHQENKCACDCLSLDMSMMERENLEVVFLELFQSKSVICSYYYYTVDDFFNGIKMILQMPEIEEIHMAFNQLADQFNPDILHIQSICSEMSEIIAKSQTLKSIEIQFKLWSENCESPTCFILKAIRELLKKVKYNKHLQALSVIVLSEADFDNELYPDYCEFIEELIHFNTTLETIQFILPIPSLKCHRFFINTVKFRSNQNFSTVNVGYLLGGDVVPDTTVMQLKRCSNLHYIHFMHPMKEYIFDFISQVPNFRNLQILYFDVLLKDGQAEAAGVKELCQVLKYNKSVQALKVRTANMTQFTHECGVALKQLLQANRTLECLELLFPIPTDCLHHIQSGLQQNTTLKELAMVVYFSIGEDFFLHEDDFYPSLQNNLKSMIVYLDPSVQYSPECYAFFFKPPFQMIPGEQFGAAVVTFFYKFYFGIIPSLSSLLHQNKQLESLTVFFTRSKRPPGHELVVPRDEGLVETARLYLQQFWKILRDHPSLKYIAINGDRLLMNDIKRTTADVPPNDLLKSYPKIVIRGLY